MDVIRLVLCPKRAKGMQKKQMTQALKNVHKRLDMSYIINKLIEFDKLKLMLLTPEQQSLFEFLPKPKLFVGKDAQRRKSLSQTMMQKDLSSKGAKLRMQNAVDAYYKLQSKEVKTPLDEKLLMSLDQQARWLLTFKNRHQIQEDLMVSQMQYQI